MEENIQQEPQLTNEGIENESTTNEAFAQNSKDVNLQKMREANEEARRTIEAQARELEALRIAQTQKQTVNNQKTESEYLLGEEDIVEPSDFNRVYTKVDKMDKKMREAEEVLINSQLRMDHHDYQKVMTQKNIDKLIDQYPEIARSLGSDPNKLTQYKSLYRVIKQFGIYQEDPHEKEKKTISENIAKPVPTNSIGGKSSTGALTQAHLFEGGLTPEVKAELRRRNKLASMNY